MPAGYVEGALIAGWPAYVLDKLLTLHGATYLEVMTREQRLEVQQAHAALHRAAKLGTSSRGNEEVGLEDVATDSTHDELTTVEVAHRLGIGRRQASNLAKAWAEAGSARLVSGKYVVDAVAVEAEHHARSA